MRDGQLAGVALLSGHELQEQLQAITVALGGMWTQRSLPWHVIEEEAFEARGERRKLLVKSRETSFGKQLSEVLVEPAAGRLAQFRSELQVMMRC